MAIEKDYLIEKRNILNEIRSNSMSLQELRLFSIYLAKINARDVSTRVVRFELADFQRIMEYGKLNLAQLRNTVDSLLGKVVGVPLETGGFARFQLFKKAVFTKNENGEWYIEIDAHDEALPLMFEFKEKYFTYALWNELKLKSSNQLRMYEILKQYEYLGERVISLVELRELLWLDSGDYPRYGNFKTWVLDVCQKALADYTDITYTYEPSKRQGRGGKITAIKFTIRHNENYIDKLSLDDFISQQEVVSSITSEITGEESESNYFDREIYPFMAEACDNEFNAAEIQVLYNLIIQIVPYKAGRNRQTDMYDYLKSKYDELNWRATRITIKRRLGYLKKIIEADIIPI